MKVVEEVQIGGRTLSFTNGQIAKQADGAVTLQIGETMVLVTACVSKKPVIGANFLPLTVDYREASFSAGKIPGGFFKREGRPSENEILICRLTDRSLRPLFPDGYFHETQIIASTISHDLENDPETMTIIGASTALMISPAPFTTPIAAVKVGRIDGELVVNPTKTQLEKSELNLLVASSADAILMVESGAKEVDEEVMVEALELGFKEAQPIIEAQIRLAKKVGLEKWTVEVEEIPEAVVEAVNKSIGDDMEKALAVKGKRERGVSLDELKERVLEQFEEDSEERKYAKTAFGDIKKKTFRQGVFKNSQRFDGRAFNEVRDITCDIDFLPRTHGSAIFTRGETQALVTTTLGAKSDAQIMDELGGEWKRRFMLHYNFPPYSVGEVRFMRGPGRREIGHGALASRALEPMLPDAEEFPYTIRIVSDILESNGSSSMATVCGGSLSLMAAGAPLKAAVAGIAMGLMKEGDDIAILSDIAGEEDHYGDMDFKVAGTHKGITALQMDIKITGVTTEILRDALAQAKEAREHILGIMEAAINEPRTELSKYAPRIVSIKIDPEKIRDVIGKGGAMIRKIIEESSAEVDVEDDGTILIYSPDGESLNIAKRMIEEIVEEPEIGKIYLGKVVSILDFGAFVQILPATQGLLHISEIANYRVNQVTDELSVGDEIKVKVIDVDKANGKVRLSRKAVIEGTSGPTPPSGGRSSGGGNPGGRGPGGGGRSSGGRGSGGGGRSSGGGYKPNRSSQGGGQNRDNQGASGRPQRPQGGDSQANSQPQNDESSPKYRSRRGPQQNNQNFNNPNRSGGQSRYNSEEQVRFPGDLGPNPLNRGGGGGRKKF